MTQTIATSFRTYYDGADAVIPPVEVPAAVFIQRHEHDNPESVARRFYRDLRVFEVLPQGGHFTVAEVPEAMADRVRRFILELRPAREVGASHVHAYSWRRSQRIAAAPQIGGR